MKDGIILKLPLHITQMDQKNTDGAESMIDNQDAFLLYEDERLVNGAEWLFLFMENA